MTDFKLQYRLYFYEVAPLALNVIVLFLAKKYQQALDISLGTCPTVFPSTMHGVAMVCPIAVTVYNLLRDMCTVPVNSKVSPPAILNFTAVSSTSGCVGVQWL